MGMSASVYYSAEMVRALPDDGNCYETVHGELLVTPAPALWHQTIVGRLHFLLSQYLAERPVGHLLQSPADISWSEDVLVQPDLFVTDLAEARTLDWANVKTLLLVIETLSPSTTRYDRFTKRRLYQEVRVPTYWIVDTEQRCRSRSSWWSCSSLSRRPAHHTLADRTVPDSFRGSRGARSWPNAGATNRPRRVFHQPNEVS